MKVVSRPVVMQIVSRITLRHGGSRSPPVAPCVPKTSVPPTRGACAPALLPAATARSDTASTAVSALATGLLRRLHADPDRAAARRDALRLVAELELERSAHARRLRTRAARARDGDEERDGERRR